MVIDGGEKKVGKGRRQVKVMKTCRAGAVLVGNILVSVEPLTILR